MEGAIQVISDTHSLRWWQATDALGKGAEDRDGINAFWPLFPKSPDLVTAVLFSVKY